MYYALVEIVRGAWQIMMIQGGQPYHVTREAYRTPEDARSAAAAMGIKIAREGDLWQVID